MPPSFSDFQKRRTPSQRTVQVPLNGALRAEAEQLREQILLTRQQTAWATLDSNGSHGIAQMEEQLARLQRELAADVAVFTFQAVTQAELEHLKLAAPPSPSQAQEGRQWDPDVFGPLLLAATCSEPGLTEAEAKTLWEDWDPWQVDLLFGAAWDACNARAVVRPLSTTGSEQMVSTELS